MKPVHTIPDFARYTAQYHAILYRYARFWVRRHQPCDSIVNQTLQQLWNQRNELATDQEIHKFLLTTVRDNCQAWIHQQVMQMKQNTQSRPGKIRNTL